MSGTGPAPRQKGGSRRCQLIEVFPKEGYDEEHLPAAVNSNPRVCAPDDLVDQAVARAKGGTLVVVNEQRIVLGRLRVRRAPTDGKIRVEDVMEAGPTTVRAHEPLVPLLERMARRQVDDVVVTTPEGELLGIVHSPKERS